VNADATNSTPIKLPHDLRSLTKGVDRARRLGKYNALTSEGFSVNVSLQAWLGCLDENQGFEECVDQLSRVDESRDENKRDTWHARSTTRMDDTVNT
jgi:hypothetical protein